MRGQPLWYINLTQGQNDIQLQNILTRFPQVKEKIVLENNLRKNTCKSPKPLYFKSTNFILAIFCKNYIKHSIHFVFNFTSTIPRTELIQKILLAFLRCLRYKFFSLIHPLSKSTARSVPPSSPF